MDLWPSVMVRLGATDRVIIQRKETASPSDSTCCQPGPAAGPNDFCNLLSWPHAKSRRKLGMHSTCGQRTLDHEDNGSSSHLIDELSEPAAGLAALRARPVRLSPAAAPRSSRRGEVGRPAHRLFRAHRLTGLQGNTARQGSGSE